MQIEGSEAKFDIAIDGNITKQTYIGKFKVKCLLSPLEEIEADKIYRELLGNNYHLSEDIIKQKAFALAQLKVRIIEYPPFWENDYIGGGHLPDSNVLMEVLDKAIEAQEKFIEGKIKEKKERTETLTKAIKNKTIQKEPELDSVEENIEDEDEFNEEESD